MSNTEIVSEQSSDTTTSKLFELTTTFSDLALIVDNQAQSLTKKMRKMDYSAPDFPVDAEEKTSVDTPPNVLNDLRNAEIRLRMSICQLEALINHL